MSDPNRAAEKAALRAENDRRKGEALQNLINAGIEFQEWPKIGRLNRDIVITEKIDGTNAAIGVVTEVEDRNCSAHYSDGSFARYARRKLNTPIVYAQSRNRLITPLDDNYGFAAWVEENSAALAEYLGEGLHFGEWWGRGIARNYGLNERRFSLFNTARWHSDIEGVAALAKLRSLGVAVYSVPVLYEGPWTGTLGYKDAATGEWLDLTKQENWIEVTEDASINEETIQSLLNRVNLDHFMFAAAKDFERDLRSLSRVNPRPRYAPAFIAEWLRREGSQAADGWRGVPVVITDHDEEEIAKMKAHSGVGPDGTLYRRGTGPEGIVVYHKASGTCLKVTLEGDEKHKGEK